VSRIGLGRVVACEAGRRSYDRVGARRGYRKVETGVDPASRRSKHDLRSVVECPGRSLGSARGGSPEPLSGQRGDGSAPSIRAVFVEVPMMDFRHCPRVAHRAD
jgi:hypothetical protein